MARTMGTVPYFSAINWLSPQPGPVNRRRGLLVGVEVSRLDAGAGERVDLPVEVLLGAPLLLGLPTTSRQ